MSAMTNSACKRSTRLLYNSVRTYSKRSATPRQRSYYLAGTTFLCAGAGFTWYESDSQARHVTLAVRRISTATKIGVSVAIDYKRTQSTKYSSEEEQLLAKSDCHKRCAERVLAGLQKLGGIYVKLGQHVSAMTYILPIEWTTTLSALQDRCDPTSEEDIRKLFLTDYGVPLDQVFDEFDWQPLGVASLAQVHKARLSHNYGNPVDWVAVKFQHPRLDEFCRIDLQTVSFIIGTIKRMFPDFGFEWILQEMQESLPQEMDFEYEAANSFIKGARIDDLEFMKEHGIDPSQVSTEITEIFSKMMFLDGFVHCDPHPGNILIRPAKDSKSRFKFDVVLLDHGLYRTLTDQLRTDYAHLWTSLIRGDEGGICTFSLRVGCRPESHRLFASLLTGREWSTISAANLSSDRSITEVSRVSGRARGFISRIYDILETLPRIVLLLLKTSDLLRGLDETLRQSGDKYITYALMGRFCAEAVWIDAKQHLIKRIKESPSVTASLGLIKSLFKAWWEYQSLEYGLWIYQIQSNARAKWALIWHHGVASSKGYKIN
ncbi:ABC1 family-domain-containing protein [Parasitella parasitica]|nr:ABC1 family-domain-containing protein [Parasitella parasitica]